MQKALGDGQQMTKEDICRNISQMDDANIKALNEIKSVVGDGLGAVRTETEKGITTIRSELY